MSSTERGGAFLSSPQLDADNALTSLNTPCYFTPLCLCISRSLCLKCSSLSYSSVKAIHEKRGRTNTSLKLSLLFCNPQSLCSTTSLVCCDRLYCSSVSLIHQEAPPGLDLCLPHLVFNLQHSAKHLACGRQ